MYEIMEDNSIRIKAINNDCIGSDILLTATIGGISDSLCIDVGGGI